MNFKILIILFYFVIINYVRCCENDTESAQIIAMPVRCPDGQQQDFRGNCRVVWKFK